MHDPLVVAFEIRRPWPSRNTSKSGGHRYWPPLITVWHREPGGHDSGTTCKWGGKWRWHAHHWRLTFPPLQHLRRRVLTRCEWCGGRSRKDDQVNFASSWDGARSPWWRGETGLRHHGCDTVWRASRKCLCDDPLLSQDEYGQCALCGKSRAWRDSVTEADRILAALPNGSRIPVEMRPRLEAIWNARLVEEGVDPATTIKPWGGNSE